MGVQFAAALLDPTARIRTPYFSLDLARDDPWRSIYAGALVDFLRSRAPELLEAGHLRPDLTFEDFLHVDRVVRQEA